jgi:hypothetical protein
MSLLRKNEVEDISKTDEEKRHQGKEKDCN